MLLNCFFDVCYGTRESSKVKTRGTDLVVQSSRLVQMVELFALFYTGMVPGALGLKECAKQLFFMSSVEVVFDEFHKNVNEQSRV